MNWTDYQPINWVQWACGWWKCIELLGLIYERVCIIIGYLHIITNLYVLPVYGFDVILAVQWFKTLGKITWDFAHLTMSITYQGTPYVLQGVQNMRIKTLDSHHTSWLLPKKKKKKSQAFVIELNAQVGPTDTPKHTFWFGWTPEILSVSLWPTYRPASNKIPWS